MIDLNQKQFSTLKKIYVERVVDNMSTKELVQYVTNDIEEWVDKLTYDEAIRKFTDFWEEYFSDLIDEVLEIHPKKEK